MSSRITATEAARNFSDLLNRVRYGREAFVIVRGGEEIGQLIPAPPTPRASFADLLDHLSRLEWPDARFADDLEEIQASQPQAGETPWSS